MIIRIFIFLILNFGALSLGSISTSAGVSSEWYANLNKAPWTPPGWVFAAAWTIIMICFSIYMALLWGKIKNHKTLIGLYALQLLLNISWNPLFFSLHQVGLAFVVIILLTLLVGYMLYRYWPTLKAKSLLIAPYVIWLLIATSLNGYSFFNQGG